MHEHERHCSCLSRPLTVASASGYLTAHVGIKSTRRATSRPEPGRTALAQGCQSLTCACFQFTQTIQSHRRPFAVVCNSQRLPRFRPAHRVWSWLALLASLGPSCCWSTVHAPSPLVPSRKYRPLFTAAARSAQGELGCLSSRDARAGPIEALAEISHFIAAANAVLAQRARLLWITVFITYDFTPAAHGPGHLVSRDFKRTHCQHRIHRQHIANQSTGHYHHHSIQRCCRRCSSSSTRISIPPY